MCIGTVIPGATECVSVCVRMTTHTQTHTLMEEWGGQACENPPVWYLSLSVAEHVTHSHTHIESLHVWYRQLHQGTAARQVTIRADSAPWGHFS